MKEIIEKIKESTVPAMKKWETDFFSWIKKLERYCSTTVYEEAGFGKPDLVYQKKIERGYSPSLEVYFGRFEEDLKAMIAKEAEFKLLKIDVAVKKKLKGVGVRSVELLEFTPWGEDWFAEGSWKINGEKVFYFKTFYAGGWNIQRQHVRTTYRYK